MRAYNFLVEIDGIARAGFRECSGLDTTTAVIEYREGNEARTPRKLTGLTTYSNVTLRWGATTDTEIWNWRRTVIDGRPERRNGSIVMLNDLGEEQLRFNFREGWPTRYTVASLNATGNDVAVDALEIAHEGLTLA